MKLTVGHFYPELLNLYGDKGNINVLKKRCEWRGIDAEVKEIKIDDSVDFKELDIIFIGGGSDREQSIVLNKLMEYKKELEEYVENGGVILAVCGGFQMLGEYLFLNDEKTEGLSLIDIRTENGNERLTSNVVMDTPFGRTVGFESHSGRVYIGNNTPLGTVIFGNGNNKEDKTEGIIYKNIIGTNLYGPLLPKNPHLADYIIKTALFKKYNEEILLKDLNDEIELRANKYIENII